MRYERFVLLAAAALGLTTHAAAVPPAAISPDDGAALASRVVILERAGKPLGLGVILNNDGRIASALSTLGNGRHVDARYADGSVVPVRLGHADRGRDLALVVPLNAKHRLGLKASQAPSVALQAPLGSFVAVAGKAAPGPAFTPTGPSSFNGNDGKPYPEALAFTSSVGAASAGSPLVDERGEVVAIVTRACKKAPGVCAPVFVGTPVTVVREFLRSAPKIAALALPSLGIKTVADDTGPARGLRITSLRGPALKSGLRAGADARAADTVIALDGAPVSTPEALEHAIEERAVGDVVDLLVLGGGRYRHVTLVISAPSR